jgi:hypothetical protein
MPVVKPPHEALGTNAVTDAGPDTGALRPSELVGTHAARVELVCVTCILEQLVLVKAAASTLSLMATK